MKMLRTIGEVLLSFAVATFGFGEALLSSEKTISNPNLCSK